MKELENLLDTKVGFILIMLLVISITFNLIHYYSRNSMYIGTVQECFDKGGDWYYVNKTYGTPSCNVDSKKIK